jgi:hypothetical protein
MTANNPRASAGIIPWPAVLVAAAVAGITQIPFFLGERWAPEGTAFDGLVGMTETRTCISRLFARRPRGIGCSSIA